MDPPVRRGKAGIRLFDNRYEYPGGGLGLPPPGPSYFGDGTGRAVPSHLHTSA
jgi:hypothetical protein